MVSNLAKYRKLIEEDMTDEQLEFLVREFRQCAQLAFDVYHEDNFDSKNPVGLLSELVKEDTI